MGDFLSWDNIHKFDSKVFLYLLSCLANILFLTSIISIIAWAQLSLVGSGLAWAGSKYRCIFFKIFNVLDWQGQGLSTGEFSSRFSTFSSKWDIWLLQSGRFVAVGCFIDSMTGEVRQLVMPLLGKVTINFLPKGLETILLTFDQIFATSFNRCP